MRMTAKLGGPRSEFVFRCALIQIGMGLLVSIH